MPRNTNAIDLTGYIYKHWLVLKRVPKPPQERYARTFWRCRCEKCDNEQILRVDQLKLAPQCQRCRTLKIGKYIDKVINGWHIVSRGRRKATWVGVCVECSKIRTLSMWSLKRSNCTCQGGSSTKYRRSTPKFVPGQIVNRWRLLSRTKDTNLEKWNVQCELCDAKLELTTQQILTINPTNDPRFPQCWCEPAEYEFTPPLFDNPIKSLQTAPNPDQFLQILAALDINWKVEEEVRLAVKKWPGIYESSMRLLCRSSPSARRIPYEPSTIS